MKSLIIKVLIGIIITSTAIIGGYELIMKQQHNTNSENLSSVSENKIQQEDVSNTNKTEVIQNDIGETQATDDLKEKLIGSWSFKCQSDKSIPFVYEFNFKENNEIEIVAEADEMELFAVYGGQYFINNNELTIHLKQIINLNDFFIDDNGEQINPVIPKDDTYDYVIKMNENECELVSTNKEDFIFADNPDINIDTTSMVLQKGGKGLMELWESLNEQ